jgi:metal-responsive CopG/Arc/MetJ family transcriptional regulator
MRIKIIKRRLSTPIHITIDPRLLRRVDASAEERHLTRSGIIRLALFSWLERHPLKAAKEVIMINGMPYDSEKSHMDYLPKNPSHQQILQTLDDYEHARDAYKF